MKFFPLLLLRCLFASLFLFFSIQIVKSQIGPNIILYACSSCDPTGTHTADLDGDGDLDVLATFNNSAIGIAWHEQTAPGILSSIKVISTAGGRAKYVTAADLDGDDDLDVLASYYFPDRVVWHENLGGGVFGDEQTITTDITQPLFVKAADFDGDGDPDVYSTSTQTSGIRIFWNNGSGQFVADTIFPNFNGSNRFMDLDFDDDGDIDIVGQPNGPRTILWFVNDGNGGFNEVEYVISYPTNTFSFSFDIGDVDGDGDLDIISTDQGGLKQTVWYENPGTGEFPYQIKHRIGTKSGFTWNTFARDVDCDGDLDVITASFDNDHVAWHENYGAGEFSGEIIINDSWVDPSSLHMDDLDGDGDPEVFATFNKDDNDRVILYDNYFKSAYIKGIVFHDKNQDGIKGDDEEIIPERLTSISSQPISFTLNDTTGFTYHVRRGTYQVGIDQDPCWVLTTSNESYSISIDTGHVDTLLFGLTKVSDMAAIETDLISGPTRCGFEVPFWLHLRNSGCISINGKVGLVGSSLATLKSAIPEPTMMLGDTMWWEVKDLPEQKDFTVKLIYEIAGADFLGDTIKMQMIGIANDSLTHESTFTSVINCSYDPNDKLTEPARDGINNYTLKGELLRYVIRFQNTGTDTAFNVAIRDYLPRDLDVSSISQIRSSHKGEFEFNAYSSIFHARFEGILLPDSTSNLVASQGYISFNIKQKSGLANKTKIDNRAEIYFDFNKPIRTNTARNTIVEEFLCADSISISGISITPLSAEIITLDQACFGSNSGSLTLIPSGGSGSYYLNDSLFMGSFENAEIPVGSHAYILSDGGNCLVNYAFEVMPTDSFKMFAKITDASGSTVNDGVIFVDTLMGGTPPFLYQWNHGPINARVKDLLPGEYVLTITDAVGCAYVDTFTVNFTTNIDRQTNPINIKALPNPFSAELNISIDIRQSGNLRMDVFDVLGRVVMTQQSYLPSGKQTLNVIDADQLETGSYLIRIVTNGKSGLIWINKSD